MNKKNSLLSNFRKKKMHAQVLKGEKTEPPPPPP